MSLILAKHPHLTGWIYTTTRFLAVKTMRGERRRLAHEHVASLDHAAMNDDPAGEISAPLQAVLDDDLGTRALTVRRARRWLYAL